MLRRPHQAHRTRPGAGRGRHRRVPPAVRRAVAEHRPQRVAAGRLPGRGARDHPRPTVRVRAVGRRLRGRPDRFRHPRDRARRRRRAHGQGPPRRGDDRREDLRRTDHRRAAGALRLRPAGDQRRADRGAVGHPPRGDGPAGGGLAPPRRGRGRIGSLRRRDHPHRDPPRPRGARPGHPPRHHPRCSGRPPDPLQAGRPHHGGHVLPDLRRRRRHPADDRGQGPRAGDAPAGAHHRPGHRGRRPHHDADRSDPGHAQAPGPHRPRHERCRPLRGQRGVRLGRAGLAARARPGHGHGQRQRRRDRPRAPGRDDRCAAGEHPGQRTAATRPGARTRHDVLRRWPRDRPPDPAAGIGTTVTGPVELDDDDLDLARWLRPGDGVFWGQHGAEPTGLVDRFIAASAEVKGLRAFCGHTWREVLSQPDALRIEVSSYGTLGNLARVAAARTVHVVPCHFSELPILFARRALPGDVALLQVAPPDRSGRCSYGVDAGYVADAVAHARVVVAEINERMPPTPGAGIAYDDLDAVVHVDRALPDAPTPRISDVDTAIAGHVAGLVSDRDTLQLGVGALPTAILGRLGHLKDLAVHSGLISDPVVDLIEAGVITGRHKPADRGLSVTGAALGSARLFDFLATTDAIRLLPASYTHCPDVLARAGHLVAINGAIEVDLTGQVNAEAIGDRYIGGVGGQVDFLRAAAVNGGVGIIAMPSVAEKSGRSRIVARLSGPVTTARSDVDVVVTEHGVAHLRGLDLNSRAQALIAIAHPDHRDDLEQALRTDSLPG